MSIDLPQREFEILLVEDCEEDAELTQYAFRQLPFAFNLNVVTDGVEALDFLRHHKRYRDVPRPDVILLDLNMPRMDGRQLLVELKRDPDLMLIPVIVLSTSSSPEDIRCAYQSQSAAYITKPCNPAEFSRSIRVLADFWLSGTTRLYKPSVGNPTDPG